MLKIGDIFLIHAGSRHDRPSRVRAQELRSKLEPCGRWKPRFDTPEPEEDVYAAFVGVVVLDEVRSNPRTLQDAGNRRYVDPFWRGPVGWYLREAVPIDPLYCKGAGRLWQVPDDLLVRLGEHYLRACKRLGIPPKESARDVPG